jgi:hypothetical protein
MLLFYYWQWTALVTVAVTLSSCFRKVPGSHRGRDIGFSKGFYGFSQSLQTNSGLLLL